MTKEIKIDISTLKRGMEFKNRTELCNFLSITPVIGGHKIDAQDKEFRRYFDFEKVKGSQRITILEVYETVRPKQKGNHPVAYRDHIETQLLHYLASYKDENGDYFVSKKELVNKLGFVNEDFSRYRQDIELLDDDIYEEHNSVEWLRRQQFKQDKQGKFSIDLEGMTTVDYAKFFQELSSAINGYLDTAFNSLVKRGVIEFKKTYLIRYDKNKPIREANQVTQEQIDALHNETLKDFNCKGIGAVYFIGIADKFYATLNSKLFKTLGISKCRLVYKFTFSKGVDDKAIQNYANTDDATLLTARDSIRHKFKARMSKDNTDWAVITDYVIDDPI